MKPKPNPEEPQENLLPENPFRHEMAAAVWIMALAAISITLFISYLIFVWVILK